MKVYLKSIFSFMNEFSRIDIKKKVEKAGDDNNKKNIFSMTKPSILESRSLLLMKIVAAAAKLKSLPNFVACGIIHAYFS